MKVLYSCFACGIYRREVKVADRGEHEEVVPWVRDTVAGALGADHVRRSPRCLATKLDEVLIPCPPGTEALGKPVKN